MSESTSESTVVQPQIAAKNPNKKLKFIIGGAVILVTIVYLMITSISSTGAYYITVSDLQNQPASSIGKKARVEGTLVSDSEDWDAVNLLLKFRMQDETGAQIVVSFHGSRPSNFTRATEAIVEGELLPDGTFRADNLLLKCPSRYEEAPDVTEFEAVDTNGGQ